MRTARVARCAALLVLLMVSCVTARYTRSESQQPISDELLRVLVPGRADLGECLRVLGAPNIVQEYRIHGMTLAWGWGDEGAFGFSVSYNFFNFAPSASFNWNGVGRDLPGVVLFFDRDLKLESIRRGKLVDILLTRQRPATIEQIES